MAGNPIEPALHQALHQIFFRPVVVDVLQQLGSLNPLQPVANLLALRGGDGLAQGQCCQGWCCPQWAGRPVETAVIQGEANLDAGFRQFQQALQAARTLGEACPVEAGDLRLQQQR